MKRVLLVLGACVALAACEDPSKVEAANNARAANNFELNRRITFMNVFANVEMLRIEGYCSLGDSDVAPRMSVICKTGPNTFERHHLALTPGVSFISQQLEGAPGGFSRPRVTFNLNSVIPDIRVVRPN